MSYREQIRMQTYSTQRGAALVIGLFLLLVLTLLAISGMNSASVEFIMAGNEQYHKNAFHAAETGIEQEIALDNFVPGAAPVDRNNIAVTPVDSYSTTVTSNNSEAVTVKGFSIEKIGAYHFQFQSTGVSSVRNARALHNQGLSYISRKTN